MRFFFNKKTAQMEQEQTSDRKFSFCETVTAGSATPWHIRELTARGPKYGGGADTPALCGRQVSWDIKVPVDPNMLHACRACAAKYREQS